MKKKIKNILVIKTSSLGDILHCFPAVSLLKEFNPDAEIDWLVNKDLAEIVRFHPDISRTVLFDRHGLGRLSASAILSLRNSLKERHYDLGFDFQGLLRNALCGKIASVERLIGFKTPREQIARIFYDETVNVEQKLHAVERNCSLVCNYYSMPLRIPRVRLEKSESAANRAIELLSENGIFADDKFVVISPCARWQSKTFPLEFFIQVIKLIKSDFPQLKFAVCGGRGDLNYCMKLANSDPDKIKNLAGKTSLSELVELIRRATAMICCDTGPMHIAAALGVQVFALFGPTSPLLTGPYGDKHLVFQADNGCINCFKRYCKKLSDRCYDRINPEKLRESFKIKIGSNI